MIDDGVLDGGADDRRSSHQGCNVRDRATARTSRISRCQTGSASLSRNSRLTLSLNVLNRGTGSASNVVLSGSVPDGLVPVNATDRQRLHGHRAELHLHDPEDRAEPARCPWP